MLLVVVNQSSRIDMPGVQDPCIVKLCTHPIQIAGKGETERFAGNRATANTLARQMIEKAIQRATHVKNESIVYVEIQDELPKRLLGRISLVGNDGSVGTVLAEVRRGEFFTRNEETTVNLSAITLESSEAFNLVSEVYEIARFLAYEIR